VESIGEEVHQGEAAGADVSNVVRRAIGSECQANARDDKPLYSMD